HLAGRFTFGASVAVKFAFIVSLLTYLAWDTYAAYHRQMAAREPAPPPPEGSYQVISVTKNRKPPPALSAEDCRWKSMILRGEYVSLRSVDGSMARFKVQSDPLKGAASLVAVDAKKEPIKGAGPAGWMYLTVTEGRKAKLKAVIAGHEIE